jgi:hypothetical protein
MATGNNTADCRGLLHAYGSQPAVNTHRGVTDVPCATDRVLPGRISVQEAMLSPVAVGGMRPSVGEPTAAPYSP